MGHIIYLIPQNKIFWVFLFYSCSWFVPYLVILPTSSNLLGCFPWLTSFWILHPVYPRRASKTPVSKSKLRFFITAEYWRRISKTAASVSFKCLLTCVLFQRLCSLQCFAESGFIMKRSFQVGETSICLKYSLGLFVMLLLRKTLSFVHSSELEALSLHASWIISRFTPTENIKRNICYFKRRTYYGYFSSI